MSNTNQSFINHIETVQEARENNQAYLTNGVTLVFELLTSITKNENGNPEARIRVITINKETPYLRNGMETRLVLTQNALQSMWGTDGFIDKLRSQEKNPRILVKRKNNQNYTWEVV